MKELTIKQKAKAYDEAIKRGLDYIKHTPATEMVTRQDIFEAIFPELKESEDEKIKNKLINLIKMSSEVGGLALHKWEADEMLTWVEKQGEHNNFIDKIQVGDKVTRNEDGMLVNLSQLDRVAKKDEKQGEQKTIDNLTPQEAMDIAVAKHFEQGEQKSADKVEPKFKVGDEIKTANEESLIITKIDEKGYWSEDLFICGFNEECIWDLVEQKSAWSEEDEAMINNLYRVIDEQIVISGDTRRMFCSWLKSLKDRVQPKQEWSEEDERKLGDIRDAITLDDELEESYKEELYDFLESLRPQPHWKPSDEQINTLEYYMHTLVCNEHKEILFGLYTDLKKLKGK